MSPESADRRALRAAVDGWHRQVQAPPPPAPPAERLVSDTPDRLDLYDCLIMLMLVFSCCAGLLALRGVEEERHERALPGCDVESVHCDEAKRGGEEEDVGHGGHRAAAQDGRA